MQKPLVRVVSSTVHLCRRNLLVFCGRNNFKVHNSTLSLHISSERPECIYLGRLFGGLSRFFFNNKTGVILEGLDLHLKVIHVLREGLHGVGLGLHLGELLGKDLVSVGHLEPEDSEDDTKQESNSDDGSQNSQSGNTLGEEEGKSQQESREDQEANNDVDDREDSQDASGLTQAAGSIERDVTHERNRVPDDDSRDVEEQVGKSDLHGFGGGKKGGKEGSDGGSNVGSQSDREHLFNTDDVHTDQRSEDRGGDGRRLDKNGDSNSDKDGQVSVDVGGLVDNAGRHTHKHLLEQPDHAEEADEQDNQTNDENGDSGDDIVGSGGIDLEEGRALIGSLVAGNKTDLGAGGLGWVLRVFADDRVEISARSSLGNSLDDVLVRDDDLLGERSNELLDGSNPLFSVTALEVPNAGSGQSSEVSGDEFDRKEDSNSQEVEHIVNGGSAEGTFELIGISHLSTGDNGVGD